MLSIIGRDGLETKFRITTKNDLTNKQHDLVSKSSMKFEVADSSGLETSELTGLIGHSIVPGRYSIDEEGFIHVGGKSIDARVEWNHNEYCHHIRSMDLVRLFLGNGIDKYSVASEFQHPRIIETQNPK